MSRRKPRHIHNQAFQALREKRESQKFWDGMGVATALFILGGLVLLGVIGAIVSNSGKPQSTVVPGSPAPPPPERR